MAILASSEIESSSWRKMAIFWTCLSILFFLMITLYLGSTFDPSSYQGNISINVVNFDRSFAIGDTFRNVTKLYIKNSPAPFKTTPIDAIGAKGNLQAGWILPDSDSFIDVNSVIDTVRSGQVWGAIVVNPGATAALQAAASNADSNYDPKSALTIIYDEGRNPSTVQNFVVLPMRALAREFQAQFSSSWITSLANGASTTASGNGSTTSQGGANLQNIAQKAPFILTTPVSWNEINIAKLSPQNSFVTFAGLSIGLMLLIIFTYAAVAVSFVLLQIIMDITDEYSQDLAGSTMVSLRLRLMFFYTLTLSLFYSFAMAAFKGTFTPGTWFAFWVLHFFHLVTHALTFMTLAVFTSAAVQAPLFLFVLVVNITSALNTPELANQFYVWSYGMPMYNAVTASRTLLFGGYPRLGYNYGAVIGWAFGFLIVYVFFQLKMSDEEDYHQQSLSRNSTIQDLEKKMSGSLRASGQFSFRDSQDGARQTYSQADEEEFRGTRRQRQSVDADRIEHQ